MVDGSGLYKDFGGAIKQGLCTGYIIIPAFVERGKYIAGCLRTERFSIKTAEGGGVLHNCYATKSAIRDLKFPGEGENLGSAIIYFCDHFTGQAVIVGVVNTVDETELNKENITVIKREVGGKLVSITLDGENAIVGIDVSGEENGGELCINVRNNNSTAKLNINVQGDFAVYSEGTIAIEAVDGDIALKTNKDVVIETSRTLNLIAKKTKINGGEQAMVLADTLQTQLKLLTDRVDAINDCLQNWTVLQGDGGAALKVYASLNLPLKKREDWTDIKSAKSFLD